MIIFPQNRTLPAPAITAASYGFLAAPQALTVSAA